MRVLISGANRGLGLGLVEVYAKRGDTVLATARRPDEARELAELSKQTDGRVLIFALDVRSEESCRSLANLIGPEPIDLLINNAGVGSGFRGLDALDMKEALELYDINALGPLRLTRAVLPHLRAARGMVLNITSLMGSISDNTSGFAYPYRMSKAALNMATKNLALELKPEHIACFVVNPGWVQTRMGGPSAPVPVDRAASQIVALADRLQIEDTGRFFHATGRELHW